MCKLLLVSGGTKNVPRNKWGCVSLCLFVMLSFAASSSLNIDLYPETCHFQGSPALSGVQPAKDLFPDYNHMVEMSSGLNCDRTMQIGDVSTSPREISQNWSLEITQTAPPEVRQEMVLSALHVKDTGHSSGQNSTLPTTDHTGRPPRGQDDMSSRENAEWGPDFEVKFDIETDIDFTDSKSPGYVALKDEISQLLYNLLSRNVDGLKAVDVISLRPGSVIAYCRLVINSTGQPLPDVSSGLGSLAGQTVTLTGHHAHITLQFPSGNLVNECDFLSWIYPHLCQDKICLLHGGQPVCICLPGFKERSTSNSMCVDVDECNENCHCCDQVCTNTIGSFTCSCRPGYKLNPDGQTCKEVGPSYFFIAATGGILRMDTRNFNTTLLPMADLLLNPAAMDFDPVQLKIYWTQFVSNGYSIRTAQVNGSEMQTVFTPAEGAVLGGLAVDPFSHLIFYTDAGHKVIALVRMVLGFRRTLINSSLDQPGAIVLDTSNGVMFWADRGVQAKIERANYDGSGRRTMVNSGLVYVTALALDVEGNRLYWTDAVTNRIESTDLLGHGRRTILQDTSRHFLGLALHSNALYVTDWATFRGNSTENFILRKPLNESGGLSTVFSSTRLMMQIHAYSGDVTGSNGCKEKNGRCMFICIPLPSNRSKCMDVVSQTDVFLP